MGALVQVASTQTSCCLKGPWPIALFFSGHHTLGGSQARPQSRSRGKRHRHRRHHHLHRHSLGRSHRHSQGRHKGVRHHHHPNNQGCRKEYHHHHRRRRCCPHSIHCTHTHIGLAVHPCVRRHHPGGSRGWSQCCAGLGGWCWASARALQGSSRTSAACVLSCGVVSGCWERAVWRLWRV